MANITLHLYLKNSFNCTKLLYWASNKYSLEDCLVSEFLNDLYQYFGKDWRLSNLPKSFLFCFCSCSFTIAIKCPESGTPAFINEDTLCTCSLINRSISWLIMKTVPQHDYKVYCLCHFTITIWFRLNVCWQKMFAKL